MSDSKKIDDGGSSFPVPEENFLSNGTYANAGMTLRDWFAGQAISSVIGMLERAELSDFRSMAEKRGLKWDGGALGKLSALMSYEIADAMIAARGRL